MKRFFTMTLLLAGAFISLSAQTTPRFAVVDMNRIIAAYDGQTEPARDQIINVIRQAAESRPAFAIVLDRDNPGILWLSPAVKLDQVDITDRVTARILSRPYAASLEPHTFTTFFVVDMNRLFSSVFAEQSEAARAFIEKQSRIQEAIERQTRELQELNDSLVTAQEEDNRIQIRNLENQIRTKTQSIQNYIRTSFAELGRDRGRLREQENKFESAVFNTIDRIMEGHKDIMMVMDRNAQGILWLSSAVNINRFDITNRVIERLREDR